METIYASYFSILFFSQKILEGDNHCTIISTFFCHGGICQRKTLNCTIVPFKSANTDFVMNNIWTEIVNWILFLVPMCAKVNSNMFI